MLFRLAFLLLILPGFAWGATWRLDPETRVSVDVPWQGGTVEVRFPTLSGDIDFDEAHPGTAKARITVSTTDVETGAGVVNTLVRSPGYLDSAAWPEMTFELDKLSQTSRSDADIFGRITLRGVTRPVTFKAKVIRYGPDPAAPGRFDAGFELTGAIDRTEFGSTGGLPDVGAELGVRIRLIMTSQ